MNINKIRHILSGVASILVAAISWHTNAAIAGHAYIPFTGEKTSWHNCFDRYDFMMDEETFQGILEGILDALCNLAEEDKDEIESALGAEVFEVERVSSFAAEGVLTMNAGLVVRLSDGSKFQLTIVQDDRGW